MIAAGVLGDEGGVHLPIGRVHTRRNVLVHLNIILYEDDNEDVGNEKYEVKDNEEVVAGHECEVPAEGVQEHVAGLGQLEVLVPGASQEDNENNVHKYNIAVRVQSQERELAKQKERAAWEVLEDRIEENVEASSPCTPLELFGKAGCP